MVAATGIATALMLLRLILGAGDLELPGVTYELGTGAGMWVGSPRCGAGAWPAAVPELRALRPDAPSRSAISSPASVGLSPTLHAGGGEGVHLALRRALAPRHDGAGVAHLAPGGAVTPAM